MLENNVSNAAPVHNFLRISEAAELANVHVHTLRRAAQSGELRTYCLPSGHRRFLKEDVLAFLGIEREEKENGGAKLIGYARVSTHK